MYQNGLKRNFDFFCALLTLVIASLFLLIFIIPDAMFVGGNPFF